MGDICEFLPKSKRQASYGEKQGLYPFQKCNKYCNEFDYHDECLIIGSGGNANIKKSCKFYQERYIIILPRKIHYYFTKKDTLLFYQERYTDIQVLRLR